MSSPLRRTFSRPVGTLRRPGVYIGCGQCGRLLNIQWATRSIVCSCGARVTPPPAPEEEKQA